MTSDKTAYIQEKEAFVSGHHGTTLIQVQLFILNTLVAYWTWSMFTKSKLYTYVPIAYLWEFILLVLPLLLSCDERFDLVQLIVTQALFGLGFLVFSRETTVKVGHRKKKELISEEAFIKACLMVFRGFLQISTVTCILAVDFPAFPRAFAKTENFGFSPMDLGVGGYVFSSGLVAGRTLFSKNVSLWESSKSTLIVLWIGIGRMVITKLIGYQEHVTEYGVHWNFFFTLGLIPITVALQRKYTSFSNATVVAVGLLGAYQVALQKGLQDYILTAPRTNFISMNREGIYSFIGYYSLFLLASHLGHELFFSKKWAPSSILKRLAVILACTQNLFAFLYNYLDWQVSRRMANPLYVLWVWNVCLFMLLGVFVVNYWFSPSQAPVIFEGMNRNQLALFLLANLLTGAVNLSINTLRQPPNSSLIILSLYLCIITGLAVLLKIKIKL